jgi:hypothetical protein
MVPDNGGINAGKMILSRRELGSGDEQRIILAGVIHPELLPSCFVYATVATGAFLDAGLSCSLRILVSSAMFPHLPGLLVAQ